jgi:hypothetical protein
MMLCAGPERDCFRGGGLRGFRVCDRWKNLERFSVRD